MKFPVRLCIGIQIFMAVFMLYVLRVVVPINILAMVKAREKEVKEFQSECIAKSENTSTNDTKPLPNYGPRYDWSRSEMGLVIGAYFIGYIFTCGVGGYIADRFGGVRVVFLATAVAGLLTTTIPLCAKIHVWLVIVVRFLTGVIGGPVYPAVHSLIARWAPPAEKGKFVAALMGNTLGTCLTWLTLGIVIEKLGWTWAYILPGMVTIVWGIIWFFTVADSPAEHRWISEEEKNYIIESLTSNVRRIKKLPPYLKIFRNVPFWALVILHFGDLWALYLLMNNGPMYMKEALGFDIKSSGALAALPYLARLTFGLIFGAIGDFIKKRELMSINFMRKFFCLFSHIIPGLLMFTVLLARCNSLFAVTVIMLSLGLNGACTLTNLQNCQDLAPNFAGTLYGLINCIGSITGFLAPFVTSLLTEKRSGIDEWNIVFAIGATMYAGSALIYFGIGSAKVQDFNEVKDENES